MVLLIHKVNIPSHDQLKGENLKCVVYSIISYLTNSHTRIYIIQLQQIHTEFKCINNV